MKSCIILVLALVLFPFLAFSDDFSIEPFVTNPTQNSIDICFQSDQELSAVILYGLTIDYENEIVVPAESFDALWGEYPVFQDPTYENVEMFSYCERVEELEPDTLYHYSVQLGSIQTPDRIFGTAPLEGAPFAFVVYGDSRSDPLYPLGVPNRFHEDVVEQMALHNFDFFLNVGDIVNDGYDIRLWNIAFGEVSLVSSEYAYYPIFGNHDDRNEQSVIGADVYSMLFSNPGDASGSGNELYYSFNYGNAHYVVIDSNADINPASVQGQWISEDLETANDSKDILWKFLFFHHPPYSSSLVGIGDERSRVTREYIPPIAEEFGVDIVFTGHQHSYERSYKNGVYYIVTGNGGALPSFFEAPALNPFSQFFEGNPYFNRFGFCIIEITGEYLSLKSVVSDGNVLDQMSIDKSSSDDDDDDNDDNDNNDDTDDDDSNADDDESDEKTDDDDKKSDDNEVCGC